jgi:hypothetical protein
MIKRYIFVVILIVALIAALTAALTAALPVGSKADAAAYYKGTAAESNAASEVSQINDDFTVEADFTSHLPLVVVDTHGQEIEKLTQYDSELEYAIPIEGVEPYIIADFILYDNEAGLNSLSDEPTFTSGMRIHRHGNMSMAYEKGNYKVNLITETGSNRKYPLLGMEKENEWLLIGSQLDKSFMRNFIAYTVAKEIMPFAPDARYCEVLFQSNGVYIYEGIYTLIENIKEGSGRVEIDTGNKALNNFLLRRDRYDTEALMLDTYATRNGLSYGYISVLYPNPIDIDAETIRKIEDRISKIERVLYSDSTTEFLTYPDYIDVDSFVDYFLINEFFSNYDAGNNSTYMYLDNSGKLKMGPVWDFDGILDNNNESLFLPKVITFFTAPWFDRLICDKRFVDKLCSRYAELRRGVLDSCKITELINDTVFFLGNAAERDWCRWRYALSDSWPSHLPDKENAYGETVVRDSETYEDEIVKLRYLISSHGASIDSELQKLNWREDIIGAGDNLIALSLLSAILIIAFLATAVIAKRL